MKQATKKQLLNAQKVDGAIISEENGTMYNNDMRIN